MYTMQHWLYFHRSMNTLEATDQVLHEGEPTSFRLLDEGHSQSFKHFAGSVDVRNGDANMACGDRGIWKTGIGCIATRPDNHRQAGLTGWCLSEVTVHLFAWTLASS